MTERTIYLAGGCFWGTDHYLAQLPGVMRTQAGYANGVTANPTYEEVCTGLTRHAETVETVYDSDRISLRGLLEEFYTLIDPTSLNRQGPDAGTQYRTGIYFTDPADEAEIRASLATLQTRLTHPIAIECEPLSCFYPAEEYHQKYLVKNPGGYCHIPPERFESLKKETQP